MALVGQVLCLNAQKHDYVWLSGFNNALLSDSTVFAVDFSQIDSISIYKFPDNSALTNTNVSISNENGNLDWYSNGCFIKNSFSDIIENGDYINSGPDSLVYTTYCGTNGSGFYPIAQGIFALPLPGNHYALFHMRFDVSPDLSPLQICLIDGLQYTLVDMNVNQGLGSVVFKDSVLLEGCFQVAIANKHANGRDWWILLADNLQGRFYRFLQTPNGIQGPWVQDIDNLTTTDSFYYGGWAAFSPDGSRMMVNDIQTGTMLYNFDRCTGLLNQFEFLPANISVLGYGLGAAFSPDSKSLYVVRGNHKKLEQYNLNAPDIADSKITVAEWDGAFDTLQPSGALYFTGFSYFQHGPDGKLYNWAGNTRYMHVMDFPNREGMDCNFRQRAIRLPNFTLGANAYYPNYRLGPVDGSACDTLGIDNVPVALFRHDWEDSSLVLQRTFTDLSYYEPAIWSWDFGDGTVSADTSPVHTFPQAGTYNVCLTVSNPYGIDTYCREVTVGTTSVVTPELPKLVVAPNPASESVRFGLPGIRGRLILNDLQGRAIFSTSFQNEAEVDVRSTIPGLYFYTLMAEDGKRWNGKVVVVRSVH